MPDKTPEIEVVSYESLIDPRLVAAVARAIEKAVRERDDSWDFAYFEAAARAALSAFVEWQAHH